MRPFLVGIAGGTGAGKTTLARALAEREPERYVHVRLDDYYKTDIPWVDGIRNWERPEALDFDTAYDDLRALREGRPVLIHGRVPQYDNNQHKTGETPFAYTVEPTPVVLFEGFLALHDERIRDLLDLSLFLSIPIEASVKRRALDPSKYSVIEYLKDILIPTHREFVEPTVRYADTVIDVSEKSAESVYEEVRAIIEEKVTT